MLGMYKVLDLTDVRGELGPMLLGDLGADVVKVEPPGGSAARREAPFADDGNGAPRSLSFQAFNRNKRSITLDAQQAADRQTLNALIQRSDFLFESHPDGPLAAFDVDFAAARALNPRLVYVRLSPFGSTGPYAGYQANDLVLAAMGGPVSIQGVPERPPLRLSVPQVWRHAGAEAAAGAMAAHRRMQQTGEAQFVDLSAQSVMTWTMLNGMLAHPIQGFDFQRNGASLVAGDMRIDMVHACADGYVLALPSSQVLCGCLPWLIEEGLADASLQDTDWLAYDDTMREANDEVFNIPQGVALLKALFERHSKQALFEYGLANNITLAPVNTLQELLAMQQLVEREYWHPLPDTESAQVRSPGLWAKPSVAGMSVRGNAPAAGEHSDEIRAELQTAARADAAQATAEGGSLPFAGLVVADFSWVGVGPISTKYLADHGAHVIRVESETRPDVLRGALPFKDMEPGLDRSQFYGDFNTSKQSLTLDMKKPEAIEIARKLISKADVMVESFAPGAISRMGLGYADVKQLNPSIIMVSTCLMGQTGPAAQVAGYGYHAGAMAGFYEVTGWPDLSPSGPWLAYTDTIAPRFVSVLLAAALDRRRRTGEGCFLDVAQIETALHFLGPELLDLQLNGVAATRMGNRSAIAAPQGCYPCLGEDRWCAVAVDTEEQWQALCRVIERQDLCTERLADHSTRLQAHDEIDTAISAWSTSRDAYDVMSTLQAAGVPAGVVQRSSDLIQDPQYAHRKFHRYMEHSVMGNVPYSGHQYVIEGYGNGPRAPAPALGQHSFEILSGLLQMGDEEIAESYASGAVS